MKKIITLFSAIFMALNLMAAPQAIIVGHANQAINIIDFKTKQIVWSFPNTEKINQGCNSVILLKDGKHIAFACEAAAKVVEIASKKVVWEYKSENDKKVSQIHSVVPLKDGGFSVFIAQAEVQVIEVSSKFEITNTYTFTNLKGGTNPHTMFRSVTMAKDGNYLVPWWPEQCVYKMTRKGEIIDKYDIGLGAFAASETPDGNLIYGSGDNSTTNVFCPKKKEVVMQISKCTQGDKTAWIQFTAHTQMIDKDKYLISNWTGHARKHQETKTDYLPVLFIANSKGEILWSYDDAEALPSGTISGISGVYYSKKDIIK